MTQVHIAHDGNGYRVYRTEMGRDRAYVGPVWPTPREAARYADALEVTADPLRAGPSMGSPVSSVPPSGEASAEPIDGVRKRRPRL